MQTKTMSMGATRIPVGLSAIIKVAPVSTQANAIMKIFSGGGTLEIVQVPAALTGSSAVGWGIGYPVGANEIITLGGPAHFYLAATGATMTIALGYAFSAGATIL
jgi:hypothetical protein